MKGERKVKLTSFKTCSRPFISVLNRNLENRELGVQIAGINGMVVIPTENSMLFDAGRIEDPSIDIGLLVTINNPYSHDNFTSFIYTDLTRWQNVRLITSQSVRPRLHLNSAVTAYGWLSDLDREFIMQLAAEKHPTI
jgi:hypothetical protein